MKSILVIAALIGAAIAQSYFYTTADDFLDMNGVVRDNLKLRAMTDCFLDKKPCDKVAASYKGKVSDPAKKKRHKTPHLVFFVSLCSFIVFFVHSLCECNRINNSTALAKRIMRPRVAEE